jgi:hypothetical protein
VKIYVPDVKALREKEETGDETQFTTKIGAKKLVWVPIVSYFMVYFITPTTLSVFGDLEHV